MPMPIALISPLLFRTEASVGVMTRPYNRNACRRISLPALRCTPISGIRLGKEGKGDIANGCDEVGMSDANVEELKGAK